MTIATTVDIESETVNSGEQAVARHWPPTILMGYEESLPEDSVDSDVNSWISLIREELYSLSSVDDIFISIEDNNVDVWVAIPKRDISVLRQLVEIEGRILETLVSGEHPAFLIDFHVIYRCGRKIEELVSNRAIRLPRQV